MDEIIILYRIDFDIMENALGNAITKKELGVFGPRSPLTAKGNCSNYISSLEPVNMYLGWDGEIYPKFVMETKVVR